MGWFSRLRESLGVTSRTGTFDEEARFHLEQRIADYIASGMSPDDARREARVRFGSMTRARERTNDADTVPWLRDLAHDLRYAVRRLRRHPAASAATIAILAVGIGANAALFTVVDQLLLRDLPVPAPERLVLFNWLEGRTSMRVGMDGVRTTDEATGRQTSTSFSYPTYLHLRGSSREVAELFAFHPIQQLNVVVDGLAEVASGQYVSGSYFSGLGVQSRQGRLLADADDRADAAPVATITHAYWQRRFAGDPRVIGRAVLLNRIPFTIVGITPPGFAGALDVTRTPDFTVPFASEPLVQGERSDLRRPAFLWVHVMGRLRDGIVAERAAATLGAPLQQAMLAEWHEAMAADPERARREQPRTLADASTLRVEPGQQGLMDTRRRYIQPLALLTACAVIVLLVTCLNVATLQLARGMARQREIATRLALGVGRGRLVRQLVVESLVIATAGSVGGLILAQWGADALLIWSPVGGAIQVDTSLNWRVLAFGAATALGTALLFGLVPAWRTTRTDLVRGTRQRGGSSPPFARPLLVAQVALSLVLLVAAGLFVGTARNLRAVDPGFDPERLLLFRVQPQLNGYPPDRIGALYAQMAERIEALPGVRSVAVSRHALLGFSRRADSLVLEPQVPDAGAEVNVVSPGYFETLRIPLLLGRGFTARDDVSAPPVAIVNRVFAERYFDGASPIGQRFWFGTVKEGAPTEIVGMARDAKYADLRSQTQPTVYVPVAQDLPGQASFAVRTTGDPLALVGPVRRAVAGLDDGLPIFDVRSQRAQAIEVIARETAFARLSALLGGIAVLLVAIGLYGVLAYGVVRRTAEIGVRMALGARRSEVVAMTMKDAWLTTLVGVGLGIPATLIAAHAARDVLADLLFGIEVGPVVLAAGSVLLVIVALLAALRPALEASRVNPIEALRVD